MKASFLTTLMTGAAMLAATSVAICLSEIDAIRQNHNYCDFAKTAGTVYQEELISPNAKTAQALKND